MAKKKETRTFSDVLYALIADSDLHLTQIAKRADPEDHQRLYQRVWRWYTGASQSLDIGDAEKIYKALTGESFQG